MMRDQDLWEKILEEPYCDPSKRMDFILFFDVRDGNPNGDPDAGNLPRMDPQTRHGIVTDVCTKRKVRDYFSLVLKRDIYIQSQEALNTLYFRAARELSEKNEIEIHPVEVSFGPNDIKAYLTDKAGKAPSEDEISIVEEWVANVEGEGLEYIPNEAKITYFGEVNKAPDFKKLLTGEEEPIEAAIRTVISKLAQDFASAKKKLGGGRLTEQVRDKVKISMCEKYDDIRLFGAVLTAGTNAGQVRGPIQITFARSLRPILQMDAAITRSAITRESDRARKQTEFGRKSWLDWAVYRQYGFYNPLLGEKTGVTKEDLARFWESLACMFRNSDSASKGYMEMRDVVVFVHDHKRGNAPSHLLFEQVKSVFQKENESGKTETKDETGKTVIKNDSFDEYYTIKAPSNVGSVKVYRPLRDIWKTGV